MRLTNPILEMERISITIASLILQLLLHTILKTLLLLLLLLLLLPKCNRYYYSYHYIFYYPRHILLPQALHYKFASDSHIYNSSMPSKRTQVLRKKTLHAEQKSKGAKTYIYQHIIISTFSIRR